MHGEARKLWKVMVQVRGASGAVVGDYELPSSMSDNYFAEPWEPRPLLANLQRRNRDDRTRMKVEM